MLSRNAGRRAAAISTTLCGVAALVAGLTAPTAAAEGAKPTAAAAVSATSTSAPVALPLPTRPPAGAVVLIGAKAGDDLKKNWYERYGTKPANWTAGADGAATPQKSDIVTQREFGDFLLHAEFRTPASAEIGHGNSGIGVHGRYEIQILGDYGRNPESHGSAALYSQKASSVNASRKNGEWQTYDIIFRAPRFDANGQVTEKPRATVFHNGVLVQNNQEFTGMTGIQYGEHKEMAKTGPLVLQGDHDAVQFRNVWVVPM